MPPRIPIGIIKTRGVILSWDTVFLCRFAPPVDFYWLPGWTLEPQENLRDWLAREIQEELGIEAKIGPLIHTQEIIREDRSVFDFWYWIENAEDFHAVDLSRASHWHEHSEVGFYRSEDFDGTDRCHKPDYLFELVKIWKEKGPVFLEPPTQQ